MSSLGWLILAIVVVAVVVGALWAYSKRQTAAKLRNRFGSEYDRTVETQGARNAEAELTRREKRVEALNIRDLTRDEQDGFADRWRQVQARFVDDPSGAIQDADVLVCAVMETRGYPVGDFEQRAADLSVAHGRVIDRYRTAHELFTRDRRGEASTEDLRNAMVHYRALYENLIGERVNVAGRSPEVNL
jgi:FtsZ-interacting cell division protein ZipA